MKRLPTRFRRLAALALAVLCHGAGAGPPAPSGQPLPPEAAAAIKAGVGRAVAQTDSLEEIGLDGPAVWHWPGLAAQPGRFRRELQLPAAGRIAGLSLQAVGGTPGVEDSLRLRLLDEAGTVLLDSSGVYLRANGLRERILLAGMPAVEAGQRITVELSRANAARPPWLAADGDCAMDGRSWLQVADLGEADIELDRDLSLRLLLAQEGVDMVPPRLRAGLPTRWSVENRRLPLSARVRDAAGVDSVWAEFEGPVPLVAALQLAGIQDADSVETRWRGSLSTAPLRPVPGDTLRGWLHALDRAGNLGSQPFAIGLAEGFEWSRESGRAETSFAPNWPGVPGMAVALRVPLDTIRSETNAFDALASGGLVRLRGAGDFSLMLVRDEGGQPASTAGGFDAISAALPVLQTEACGDWHGVQFELPDSLRELQGSTVWLVLRYENMPDHEAPPAVLAEEADSSGALNALSTTAFVHHPLTGWSPWLDSLPLLRVRLSIEDCDYDLAGGALQQDFEQVIDIGGLRCWSRNGEGSAGWQVSAGRLVNTAYFQPQALNEVLDALWDPGDLQHGEFLYINSDAWPQETLRDTLFTPVLVHGEGGFVLGMTSFFSSYYNDDPTESGEILLRSHAADLELAPWQTIAVGADFAAVAADTLQDGEYPFPVWRRWELPVDWLDEPGLAQLAFAYRGTFAFGWGLDSLTVAAPAAPGLEGLFDNGRPRTAELGRAHPNPFNPSTRIPYRVLVAGPLRLSIHNLLGQRVAVLVDEPFLRPGSYLSSWEPQGQASGIYFLRLEAGGSVDHRRLLYLK
jgi:hypothetical protein